MKPGTKVRMNQEIKDSLIKNGCRAHVEEFGDCVGIVEDLVDYGDHQGPEVNVRWQPSKLRYSYHPDGLKEVT